MGTDDAAPTAGTEARISVVLATYNGEAFLAQQLASLRSQALVPDELIVVDDASTDRTPEILTAFAASAGFPVDLVLRSEHLGTWTTFEEGLRRATGDILVVCDQDDIWRPEKLAVIAARMAAHPDALMAFSDAYLIDAEGQIIGRSRWRIAGFTPQLARGTASDPFGPILSHQAVAGCTMAIRSRALEAILPFPADVHPGLPTMMYDRWISLLAAAAGEVLAIPERLVDYRIHPGQQVGIPGFSVRRLVPRLALCGAQFLHPHDEVERRMGYHVAHLDEIEKRLDAANLMGPAVAARLAAAREHLRFREEIEGPHLARARGVRRELRRQDGYRRFSLGLPSALADVVR